MQRTKSSSTKIVASLAQDRFNKPVPKGKVNIADFTGNAHRLIFAILYRDNGTKKLSCIFDIVSLIYEHRCKQMKTGIFVINRGVHNLVAQGTYKYWFIETETGLVQVNPTCPDSLYDKLNVTVTREDDHTVTREIDYTNAVL